MLLQVQQILLNTRKLNELGSIQIKATHNYYYNRYKLTECTPQVIVLLTTLYCIVSDEMKYAASDFLLSIVKY